MNWTVSSGRMNRRARRTDRSVSCGGEHPPQAPRVAGLRECALVLRPESCPDPLTSTAFL